jgi:hypothetical protein
MTKQDQGTPRIPEASGPTVPQLRDKAASLLDKAKDKRGRPAKPN